MSESAVRLLIVEDERIVAENLRQRLESVGYGVAGVASSGQEALELSRLHRPDLALVDIRLSGEMDGIDAAARMRAEQGIPIIYLTAYADPHTLARAKPTEPFGYLLKPFEARELESSIEIALYKHSMEKRLRDQERRLEITLASIGDGVISTDLDRRITFLNRAAAAMTGWTRQEALGRRLEEVYQLIDEESRLPVESGPPQTAPENGAPQRVQSRLLIHRDGSPLPIEENVSAILDERGSVAGSVLVFQNVSRRRNVEQQLRYSAFHDALTGLPNRSLFLDRLGHRMRLWERDRMSLFAVLFLDLDRFKLVNDSFGHGVGDLLLIEVARRLEKCLRVGDTLARLGGDEFTCLLEGLSGVADAEAVAQRICRALVEPMRAGEHEIYTSASIGIAPWLAEYRRPEEMLRDADTAMYRAKAEGKARHVVFDRQMYSAARSLLELELGLRAAAGTDQFLVHYQPISSVADSRVVGVEALVRWQHPRRGMLTPAAFLALAEETGLITAIDHDVIGKACRQVCGGNSLRLSLNLSGRTLMENRFVERLEEALEESGLDRRRLRLEITERALSMDTRTLWGVLEKLRARGFDLCLDDFGAGYSSLGSLAVLPVQGVKIDRSFITRLPGSPRDLSVLKAVADLAHSLGMQALAKGVETAEQLDMVRQAGCDEVQGSYLCGPMPAGALSWLKG